MSLTYRICFISLPLPVTGPEGPSKFLVLSWEVFERLKQLWMGIWQHSHTVTTTELSPDLGEFTEILDDVSVELIPLRYR